MSRLIDRGTRLGLFRSVETDEVRRVVSTFLDGAMVYSIIRRDFDLRRTIETFRDVLWCYLVPDSKERPVSRS